MYLLGEVRSFWGQGGKELVLGLPASSTQRWMSSLAYSVRSSLVCPFLFVSGTTEAASALWEAWSPTWRLLCCRSLSSFPCLFSRISGLGCLKRIDYFGGILTLMIVLLFLFLTSITIIFDSFCSFYYSNSGDMHELYVEGSSCGNHRWASPFSLFSLFANRWLPFVSLSTNGQITNLSLHDEKTVKGLGKIAWASDFCLKQQHIRVYIQVPFSIYIFTKMELMENGAFHLFAANENGKLLLACCRRK